MNSLRRWMGRIAILLLTTSCGIEVADKPDTLYVPYNLANAASEETGYVVGSIGLLRKAKNFQTYRFYLRPVGTDDRFQFFFYDQSSFTYRPDFVDNGAEIRLFATPLRAGRYEMFRYEFTAMRVFPPLTGPDRPDSDFSFQFDVKPGQTTYLGQFKAVPQMGRPVLGMPNILAYYWEIADRRARDLAAAQQRLPGVKTEGLIAAVPDPSTMGLRYFARDGGAPPD
jgi:hypothetical protein